MTPAESGSAPRLCTVQMVETLWMGGAETLAVRIANELAERGHDSHLYVLVDSGPLAERVDPRVSVREFGIARKPLRNLAGFAVSTWQGFKRLRRALKRDRPDAIQCHLPGANFWGLLLALCGAGGVVPTVHNTREFDYGDADDPLRAKLRRAAYRLMLGRCPRMVAVSDPAREALLEALGLAGRPAPKLHAVPNGVAIPDPLPEAERAGIRTGYGCGADETLLLAAGRHGEQKNFRTLIEALSLLPEDAPPWRLVLAGEGELRDAHIARATELGLADRIAFPGVVTDLDRLMRAADLFLLPSLWEGLPLVLLEAMAAGLPVLGSRIDGLAEVIEDGREGVLTPPGDAPALADALDALLRDPARRADLAAAALTLVRRDYGLERVVDDLVSIYTLACRKAPDGS